MMTNMKLWLSSQMILGIILMPSSTSLGSSSFLTFKDSSLYLTATFDDTLVTPGTSIILSCSAGGLPLPHSARWTFNRKPIVISNHIKHEIIRYRTEITSILNITSVKLSSSGLYTCFFENDLLQVEHSARLNVQGNPIAHDNRLIGQEGYNVTMECLYGGYPIHSIIWEKDDQQLPSNHRQHVDTTKATLTIRNLMKEDSGLYKCIIVGHTNATAVGHNYLNVGAPPVIDGIFFPDSRLVEEGTKVNIICFINKGDSDIHFTWFKDDQPLNNEDEKANLIIEKSNHSSSILFKSVRVADRGDFTCQASNKYGKDARKTRLIVQSKPKWRIEPASRMNGTLSKQFIINCDADGHPRPNITWSMRSESISPERFVTIKDGRYKILDNGSLVIEVISEEDDTQFMCTANNGIGDSLSKIINFKVNRPPKISTESSSIEVKKSENAVIKCTAYGDLPLTMEWTKSSEKIKSNGNREYLIKTGNTQDSDGITSMLTIKSVKREDEDVYSCVSHNDFGYASVSIRLLVIEKPGKPVSLEPGNVTSRFIELKWRIPFDGNSLISQCHVTYRPINEDGVTLEFQEDQKVSVEGPTVSTIISNLQPLTTYTFRVNCENSVGQSDLSDPVNITTRQEAPEGPPQSIRVQATGSQSLKVTWSSVAKNLQHGPILAYYVGYKTESASDRYQFKHYVVNMDEERNSAQFTTYLTNLRPLTRYWVVVQAYNSAGSGPLSDPVVGVTLETSPPISPIISVVGTTNDSIEISWERDVKDKSIIREYNLYFKEENRNTLKHIKLEPELRSYVLKELSCGTKYSLFMTATNSLGTGEPSQKVIARTKGAAPVSPTRMSSVIWINRTEVVLNLGLWNNGGCSIHYFDIKKRPKHTNIWTPVHEKLIPNKETKKEVTLRNFVPGLTYVILVTAKNDAGITQAEYLVNMPNLEVTYHQSTPRSSFSLAKSKNTELTAAYEEVPLYRNMAFILPTGLSLAIIIFLLLLAFYCINRQPQPIYNHYSAEDDGKASNSLSLSELSSQKSGSRANMSAKCLNSNNGMRSGSIGSGLTTYSTGNHMVTERHYATHQYSEPYSTGTGGQLDPRSCQASKDHFATIKRGVSGPRPSPYIST